MKQPRLLAIAVLLLAAPAATAGIDGVRNLPDCYRNNQAVPVTLTIQVNSGTYRGLVVEESLPEGWILSSASPPPQATNGNRISWVFAEAGGLAGRTIRYSVLAPESGEAAGIFSGNLFYLEGQTNTTVPVGGDGSIGFCPTPTHTPTATATFTATHTPTHTATPTATPVSGAGCTRILPPGCYESPGQVTVTLELTVDPLDAPFGIILDETFPEGWTVAGATPAFNQNIGNLISWVLFNAGGVPSQTVRYTLNVPPGQTETVEFSGTISFILGGVDRTEPIVGDRYCPRPTATSTATATLTLTPTRTPAPPSPTLAPDVDGDGIANEVEAKAPLGGETNMYLPDSDGDGLGDGVEDLNRNGTHKEPGETDPRSQDTDLDGYEDGIEVLLLWSDPLDDADPEDAYVDSDRDGLPSLPGAPWCHDPDDIEPDYDGDRILDGYEAAVAGMAACLDPLIVPQIGNAKESPGDPPHTVDNADAQMILQFFASLMVTDFRPEHADTNRDAFIDNGDAQRALMYFAIKLPYLPE